MRHICMAGKIFPNSYFEQITLDKSWLAQILFNWVLFPKNHRDHHTPVLTWKISNPHISLCPACFSWCIPPFSCIFAWSPHFSKDFSLEFLLKTRIWIQWTKSVSGRWVPRSYVWSVVVQWYTPTMAHSPFRALSALLESRIYCILRLRGKQRCSVPKTVKYQRVYLQSSFTWTAHSIAF